MITLADHKDLSNSNTTFARTNFRSYVANLLKQASMSQVSLLNSNACVRGSCETTTGYYSELKIKYLK